MNGKLIKSGISGGEVRTAEIMKEFILNGWEVHLLANKNGNLFCEQFELNNVINHSFNFSEARSRFWFIILTLKTFFSFPADLKNFNGYLYSADEQLYDIIPALKLKIINKNKWIAVVHWVPPIKFWQRKKSFFFVSLIFMLGEILSIPLIKYFSDIVLAISDSTRKQLLKLGFRNNKAIAVKCGVNFQKISKTCNGNIQKKYDAIFMKRIQAVKGAFDLIDIWKLVVRQKPEAKLAIVGGSIDNDKLIDLIRIKKLGNKIFFLGPILDFKEKIKVLASAELFILPSYEENWAIVMGEAMACKIPVLAYNLPELIDVWKDSFVPIPLEDKEKFAEEIIRYLDDKRLREKQAEKGYKYVQQFDWEKIAKEEIKIIENL